MIDSTRLFGDRVQEYVKCRPGYPVEILDCLRSHCGLRQEWRVADVGCGPGNLARLFLANGNEVFGVEPNKVMREAGETLLAAEPLFHAIDGRAEATTLPDHSVQLAVAGQAFHWFDPVQARAEMQRILVEPGWVALVWNMRQHSGSAFMEGYEQILGDLLPDYRGGAARSHGEENIGVFFGGSDVQKATFTHAVEQDWDSLFGLVQSTSYTPKPGQSGHEELKAAFKGLFDREQIGGVVKLLYTTVVHLGKL